MMQRHRHNGADIDRAIHAQPDPVTVAKLIASHGFEAALTRWWYLSDRTVGKLGRVGHVRLTGTSTRGRGGPTAVSAAEDRAVAVEAGIALGSARRGERAAGLRLNAGRAAFEERGLDPIAVSPDERGRMARLSARANRGDAEAVAAIEAQHALERAVGAVVRAALRIVPDQPPVGQYRLPEPGAELSAALQGHDPLAVEIVFSTRGERTSTEPEPEPEPERAEPAPDRPKRPALAVVRRDYIAGQETAAALATRYGVTADWLYAAWRRLRRDEGLSRQQPLDPRRKVPPDDVLRADHAAGRSMRGIARRYGVSSPALLSHWQRLGLPPLNNIPFGDRP